jgi:predicted acetyltransferase
MRLLPVCGKRQRRSTFGRVAVTELAYRPAAPADLDRLIEIHAAAFPDPRDHAERRKNFTANPLGEMDALWVAVAGGEILAHAFLFPLRAWFAGGSVEIGAVASVGVAPEARGRGVGRGLLEHLHRQADERGAAVLVLYAFRQGFYARHGYAAATPSRWLRLHPASIPAAWRREEGVQVRGAREGDRAAIEKAYARSAARAHGWIARPAALWDRKFANERRIWVVATRARKLTGYVCWVLEQAESHAATRLVVRDLIADDAATRRALLGAVGAQRDQVSVAEIEVSARDPLDRALTDADRGWGGTERIEHALGTLCGGPMVRLVDTARALAQRAYAADGAIDLLVDGRTPLHLAVTRGKGTVSLSHSRAPRAPLIIERPALGAVLYGGLTSSEAAALGWARAENSTLARADALFASPPFFALDAY